MIFGIFWIIIVTIDRDCIDSGLGENSERREQKKKVRKVPDKKRLTWVTKSPEKRQ